MTVREKNEIKEQMMRTLRGMQEGAFENAIEQYLYILAEGLQDAGFGDIAESLTEFAADI